MSEKQENTPKENPGTEPSGIKKFFLVIGLLVGAYVAYSIIREMVLLIL